MRDASVSEHQLASDLYLSLATTRRSMYDFECNYNRISYQEALGIEYNYTRISWFMVYTRILQQEALGMISSKLNPSSSIIMSKLEYNYIRASQLKRSRHDFKHDLH